MPCLCLAAYGAHTQHLSGATAAASTADINKNNGSNGHNEDYQMGIMLGLCSAFNGGVARTVCLSIWLSLFHSFCNVFFFFQFVRFPVAAFKAKIESASRVKADTCTKQN